MSTSEYIRSKWNFDGYEWEIQFYPMYFWGIMYWLALKLKFLGGPLKHKQVRASLSCRIVDPSGNLQPSKDVSTSHIFQDHQDCSSPVFLEARNIVRTLGYVKNDTLTVECTITVLKDLEDTLIPAKEEAPLPSSDLHQHLGELLESHTDTGADVTFIVSGERFPAHKSILAARSSVFRALFFGNTNGGSSHSQCVQVNGVEPAVFKAMLRFIYTDVYDEARGMAGGTMPRQLLAAADRYGLDRLKLICERKLSGGINVDTVATTLALAERHSCSLLKAKCIEFIIGSPERLDAVLATEGYKHLAASCPLAVAALLKAAHGKKN
ncbi:unnamed protein product [Urochloa humidicola]